MDLSASKRVSRLRTSTVGCGVSGRALVVPEAFERGGSGGGMGRAEAENRFRGSAIEEQRPVLLRRASLALRQFFVSASGSCCC